MSGPRYLVTSTGRRLHIVRENAYHSENMPLLALCGAHGRATHLGDALRGPTNCKTCNLLWRKGTR